MYEINRDSLNNSVKSVNKVFFDNKKNSKIDFKFKDFTVKNHPGVLAAIDGSNNSIKGINFVLAVLRTGHILYQDGVEISRDIDPLSLEFIMNNEDPEVGYEFIHEKYYHGITGEIPRGILTFDKVVERIRTLLEWQKVSDLVDKLNKNDIIIFDGSLISGEISTSHEFFENLTKKVKEKGIILVGLSKDTSLSIDSSSVRDVLLESSKLHKPNSNWLVNYEEEAVFFVKFSHAKDLIYRVDAVIPDHLSMEDVVSWVGSYAFSDFSFGYPYPMQRIHEAVLIKEAQRDYAFGEFKSAALKSGISHSEFNKMFDIFHDKMDILSLGR